MVAEMYSPRPGDDLRRVAEAEAIVESM